MSPVQFQAITAVLGMWSVHLLLIWIRHNFRKNIAKSDIVGIRFGDYVVNREVHSVSNEDVGVMDFDNNLLVFVPKDRVYLKSNSEGEFNVR